jgi:hypothetical protein
MKSSSTTIDNTSFPRPRRDCPTGLGLTTEKKVPPTEKTPVHYGIIPSDYGKTNVFCLAYGIIPSDYGKTNVFAPWSDRENLAAES